MDYPPQYPPQQPQTQPQPQWQPQQPPQYPQYPQQPYPQPPQPPQPQSRGLIGWFKSASRPLQIGIGCGALLIVCGLCGGIAAAIGSGGGGTTAQTSATATATPDPNASAPAYKALVVTDSSALASAFTQVGTDCGNNDVAACKAGLQSVHDVAASFLADLDHQPAPPCLHAVDAQLREALTNYINGSTLAIQGIDNVNTDDVQTGTAMIQTGTTDLNKATTAANNANC